MIFEQQIKLWRSGGAELEFVFACLVEELVFSRKNPAEWNIVPSSVDAHGINRILRREEETIHYLNQSHSSGKNWGFLHS